MKRPYVWQMIKQALEDLNRKVSYSEIKEYINRRWDDVNQDTINAQIIVLSVNHSSRVHYPENYKPRLTNVNSPYDFLFKTHRGEVEKYDFNKHGIWEIYKNRDDKLAVRQYNDEKSNDIFTPADITWIKSVTNSTDGEAYLQLTDDRFILHFPTKHKANVLSPAVNELILIYQKVNGVAAFTHIVTPIDNQPIDSGRPNYRYGRWVKVIAKTTRDNFIPVSSTLWTRLNFSGITQGNACRLANISSIGNLDELQFDIWKRFAEHFISSERNSLIATSAIISELEITNPNISVIEGELRLVAHMVKERNRKIVNEKKQQALVNDVFYCEVCTFSFMKMYQANFIECHHLTPIAQSGPRETKLEDLALVCANCHRMLHTKFDGQFLTLQQLQMRIKSFMIVD